MVAPGRARRDVRDGLRRGALAARRCRGYRPAARTGCVAARPLLAHVMGRTAQPLGRRPSRHRTGAVVVLLRDAPRHDGIGVAAAVATKRGVSKATQRARRRKPCRSRGLLGVSGCAAANARRLPWHRAWAAARGVQPGGGEGEPLRRRAVASHGVGDLVRHRAVGPVERVVGSSSRDRASGADGLHSARDREPLHVRPADRRCSAPGRLSA